MVSVWPLIVDQVELHASVNMAGGLRGVFLGTPWPDFWDTRAFAFVLREAAGGFKPFAPLPKYRNPYIPKVLASKGEKVLNLLRDALLNWDSPRLPLCRLCVAGSCWTMCTPMPSMPWSCAGPWCLASTRQTSPAMRS